ncbi:MAG: hypothetical protein AB1847_08690 [bacterium]
MRKKLSSIVWLGIGVFCLWTGSPKGAHAQFYPYLGSSTTPLLSTSYMLSYLSPYYYNTLLPMSSYGQFDPSINLDEVTLSLDTLYSPAQYRTFDPSSLQGLYQFSPSPFNYLWNSMVASQDSTITVNPYFATPFYYPLLNKGYFSDNPAERIIPLPLFSLYSFAPHLPELLYTATQAGLAPTQNFTNALGISLLSTVI